MPSLMHAADVLIQNAGGMTVLEAVAAGLPVITYRSIPGHGLTNAAALDEAGVARWVRHQGELAAALEQAVRSAGNGSEDRDVVSLPGVDVVELLLETAGLEHLVAARPAAGHAVAEHHADQATAPMEYVR